MYVCLSVRGRFQSFGRLIFAADFQLLCGRFEHRVQVEWGTRDELGVRSLGHGQRLTQSCIFLPVFLPNEVGSV